jgi:hypothetical protein
VRGRVFLTEGTACVKKSSTNEETTQSLGVEEQQGWAGARLHRPGVNSLLTLCLSFSTSKIMVIILPNLIVFTYVENLELSL